MELLASAQNLLPEIIDLRRKIHANPEVSNHLPETTKAVVEALDGLDLDIRFSSETTSLVATLHGAGNGPRIMLRGDMDALPMPENNDLPFASKNEGMMHACGHDSHTAMLPCRMIVLTRFLLPAKSYRLFRALLPPVSMCLIPSS